MPIPTNMTTSTVNFVDTLRCPTCDEPAEEVAEIESRESREKSTVCRKCVPPRFRFVFDNT
jgi:hypothetical protein